MNCGDISELAPLWHTGELDSARQTAFDAHLAQCPGCAADIREQWANDGRLREAISAEPADTQELERQVTRRIAGERVRRWLVPGVAAATAVAAAALFLAVPRKTPVNPVILADAARDHTAEVIKQVPRHWRTTPAEIAALEVAQGISDSDVQALEATGYHLQRAKICRLGGAPYMHLVYGKNGREFSVYMRVRGDQVAPDGASSTGNLQLTSFARGHVQAVIVTDAPHGECERFTREAESAL